MNLPALLIALAKLDQHASAILAAPIGPDHTHLLPLHEMLPDLIAEARSAAEQPDEQEKP